MHRISIVDDEPGSIESYGFTVEDADRVPVPQLGPLGSLDDYLSKTHRGADAGLSDFDLHTHSYADFTGAELVARWYDQAFPGVLCTRYEKAQIERIRPYRRKIPVLLKPDELNIDTLMTGLEKCIREISGDFTPVRRPWRTQVHFLYQDNDTHNTFFAEIPGWSSTEILKIRLDDLPAYVRINVREDYRCHAYANVGAVEAEDLYLCDWVTPL